MTLALTLSGVRYDMVPFLASAISFRTLWTIFWLAKTSNKPISLTTWLAVYPELVTFLAGGSCDTPRPHPGRGQGCRPEDLCRDPRCMTAGLPHASHGLLRLPRWSNALVDTCVCLEWRPAPVLPPRYLHLDLAMPHGILPGLHDGDGPRDLGIRALSQNEAQHLVYCQDLRESTLMPFHPPFLQTTHNMPCLIRQGSTWFLNINTRLQTRLNVPFHFRPRGLILGQQQPAAGQPAQGLGW